MLLCYVIPTPAEGGEESQASAKATAETPHSVRSDMAVHSVLYLSTGITAEIPKNESAGGGILAPADISSLGPGGLSC